VPQPDQAEATDWQILRRDGSAQELHDLELPVDAQPQLWDLRIRTTAIVLGARQTLPAGGSDLARADGIEVAGRRSGGGAVLIDPRTAVWIDVLIPAGHAWFAEDLTRTFMVVGEKWSQALAVLGHSGEVFAGRPDPTDDLATRVCFAGLGWGEVTIGGSKVVGLSQRRTRWGARVQCLADLSGAAARLGRYVGVDPGEQAVLDTRCGLEADASPDAGADRLRTAFLARF